MTGRYEEISKIIKRTNTDILAHKKARDLLESEGYIKKVISDISTRYSLPKIIEELKKFEKTTVSGLCGSPIIFVSELYKNGDIIGYLLGKITPNMDITDRTGFDAKLGIFAKSEHDLKCCSEILESKLDFCRQGVKI